MVSPTTGSPLGGFEVTVSWVCLDPAVPVTCRFGAGAEIPAAAVNEYRATCIAPLLTQTGSVPVSMFVDGVAQSSSGQIYVGTMFSSSHNDTSHRQSNVISKSSALLALFKEISVS